MLESFFTGVRFVTVQHVTTVLGYALLQFFWVSSKPPSVPLPYDSVTLRIGNLSADECSKLLACMYVN